MKATLLIFFLATGIPACVQLKQGHDLEERTAAAVRTLRSAYVLTSNQKLQIVYANAWAGNICMEYVTDDARSHLSFAMPLRKRIRNTLCTTWTGKTSRTGAACAGLI